MYCSDCVQQPEMFFHHAISSWEKIVKMLNSIFQVFIHPVLREILDWVLFINYLEDLKTKSRESVLFILIQFFRLSFSSFCNCIWQWIDKIKRLVLWLNCWNLLKFVEKFQIICKSKCDDVIRLLRIINMYKGMFI